MNRATLIRLAVAALLGAVLASALLAVISRVNVGGGFSLATVASARGWFISLVAGTISAALAWTLLLPRRERSHSRSACHPKCPVCGGVVGRDWRLCPHCGEIIG